MGFFSKIQESLQKKQEEREAQKAAEAAALDKIRLATANIRNGSAMPEPMQSDGRIILDKNEKVYLILPGLQYLEERTSRINYGGGGAGFRVAKGVTLRIGGGTAMPVHQLQVVDNGSLYITDKKVMFAGTNKSVVFPIKKIVECNRTKAGLHIASSTKKTPIIVVNNGNHPEAWDYADASLKALIAHAT